MLTDEEVIARVISGEKHLYESLMRKYNLRLYRISRSIINDDMAVEDVMQTAYLNAYLNLAGFQNKSSFSTWLTRILINESLLYKKKQLKREQLIDTQGNNYLNETPLHGLMNKELKTLLEKSIDDLPEKYKLVFVMREIEEMSTSETMGVLNLSESNVKIRLNRAKEMLRGNLSGYYKSHQVYEFNLIHCDRVVNFVMSRINNELAASSAKN
jgi:RNA polymerase sigma factor (sigma-70 family)